MVAFDPFSGITGVDSGSPSTFDVTRRQALAKQLLDAQTPAKNGLGVLANILSGSISGYENKQASQEAELGKTNASKQLADILASGTPDKAALGSLVGNDFANQGQQQVASALLGQALTPPAPYKADYQTFNDANGDVQRYDANDPNAKPSLFFDNPDKPPGDPFGGTSLDAQDSNILLKGDRSSGAYALAYSRLTQPRTQMVQTADGLVPMMVTPQVPQSILPPIYPGQTPPAEAAPGGDTEGLIAPGNIDLHNRPIVKNADGSISTVRSMSFEEDGKEILVPTVSPDGRILSDQEAIDLYHKTGQFLGKFSSPEAATKYAEALHNEQAAEYLPRTTPSPAASGPVTAGAVLPNTRKPATEGETRNKSLGEIVLNEVPTVHANFKALTDPKGQFLSMLGPLGNAWQSSEYQQAANGLKSTVSSVLYSLSGASSNPGEVINQIGVLSPAYGDKPAVIADKLRRFDVYVKSIADASNDPDLKAAVAKVLEQVNAPSDGGAGLPKITGDSDYDALPSGAHFLDPSGTERIKP